jgi:hypothetical protein
LGTLLTIALAGFIIVIAIGALWFLSTRPVQVSGILTGLQGAVESRAESEAVWTVAANDQRVGKGEHVRTGGASSAGILFFDTSTVNLGENTEINIQDASATRRGRRPHLSIGHWVGQLSLRMIQLSGPQTELIIETPNATTTASGGAQIQTTVNPGSTTTVRVDVGSANVTSHGPLTAAKPAQEVVRSSRGLPGLAMPAYQAGLTVVVVAGQTATIDANGIITVTQTGGQASSLPELVAQALGAPGTTFTMTLTEQMVNAYISSTDLGLEGYGISNPVIWFSGGNAIISGNLSPAGAGVPIGGPFTLVTTPAVNSSGSISLSLVSANVGGVPLPANVINQSIALAESAITNLLADPAYPIQLTAVQVNEGSIMLTGNKPAP